MRCVIAHACLCTCLKHWRPAKKSTPCLIKKASRCATDCTSKTKTCFIFLFLYNTKIVLENHVYLFLIWLVQWWKLLLYLHFLYTKDGRLQKIKIKHEDGTIVFLTSWLIALTWNILPLISFWQKIISCFE